MTDKIVVLCACASEEEAGRIARHLVDGRLAACVSVVPRVKSIYHWKGAVESAEECLLLIKSARGLFADLRAELEKIHPYEVPEILALPVVEGSAMYLEWMASSLREHPGTPT